MARKLDFAGALLLGLCFAALMPWSRMLSAQNDFAHFYIGASLYGTADIFSPEANYRKQEELIGGRLEHSFFGRPAFYAFLLRPLAGLPYKTSYWIFQFGSLGAFCVFIWLNTHRLSNLPIFCAMSLPLFANFVNGQDVSYLLMFCSISLLCASRNWDLAAGMVLALCGIKGHLFVLVPLAAIFWRRWRIVAGGAIGGIVLTLLGMGADTSGSQVELLRQLLNPEHSPYPDLMPSVRSITGDHIGMFLVASATVLAMAGFLMHRSKSYEAAFGWALIGGLLASFHAYMQDGLLLLLGFVLIHRELGKAAKVLLQLALLPFVYVALIAGSPYSAVFPSLLLVCFAAQLHHTMKSQVANAAFAEA